MRARELVSIGCLLICCGIAWAQTALVWEHEAPAWANRIAENACLEMGLTTTVIRGERQTDFRAQLALGAWDVVVVNNPYRLIEPATLSAMQSWVDSGGRLHASYWDADQPSVAELFGFVAALERTMPTLKLDNGDVSWGSVGILAHNPTDPYYLYNGNELTLRDGYRSGLDAPGGRAATSVGPRTIFNAWDYRSMLDQDRVKRGIKAQIAYLLRSDERALVFAGGRRDARWEVPAADMAFGIDRYDLIDGDVAALETALRSGRYGTFVIHQPSNPFPPSLEEAIRANVLAGANVHMSYWQLDASPSLQSAFGIASTTDFFVPRPVFDSAGHASWGGSGSPVEIGVDAWGDNGDELIASTGAQVVSRFDSTTGAGATVVGPLGRGTLFNGFDYDSLSQRRAIELLRSQMVWVANSGCINFEELPARSQVTSQYPGIQFSTTGGEPASAYRFPLQDPTQGVLNSTDGGSSTAGIRPVLRMDFDTFISSIEFDFYDIREVGPSSTIRFYDGGRLIMTRWIAPTRYQWRRDIRFDGLQGIDRIDIEASEPGAGFMLDNICFEFACRADFDGDAKLNIFDFLAFQNAFDAGNLSADFDGDGQLTIFDFLVFQNEFAAGCS